MSESPRDLNCNMTRRDVLEAGCDTQATALHRRGGAVIGLLFTIATWAAPAAGDEASALAEARQLYFDGEHERALEALRPLTQADVSPATRLEALLWTGEIQFVLGDELGARATFRVLLMEDPAWPISAYEHPLDVVGAFEITRRAVAEAAAPPRPAPLWTLTPGGIPQYALRKPAAGALWTTLQVGFGAASIGTYIYLDRLPEGRPAGLSDEDLPTHAQTIRYAVQFPATVGFYGAWLGSVLAARASWRDLTVGAAPLPGGGGLVNARIPLGGPRRR